MHALNPHGFSHLRRTSHENVDLNRNFQDFSRPLPLNHAYRELCEAAYEECPQAQYTGIAMEHGTLPMMEVLQALRADHWLHLHPDAPPELARNIKRQMMDAFYTDTGDWKAQVLQQARESLFQAADGLGQPTPTSL